MNYTMHDLACQRIQVDEIWSFVGKKQRRLTAYDDPTKSGDMWTFVAIDADSKLVPCYRVGKRSGREAQAFMADLESRLSNPVQLSSDALSAYVEAVERAFEGTHYWTWPARGRPRSRSCRTIRVFSNCTFV